MPIEEATTGLALQLAGIDTLAWRKAMDRGHFQSAPKTLPGDRQRKWNTNDIVVLRFFQYLNETLQMPAATAGGLAKQLEIALLKDPDAKVVGLYVNRRSAGGRREAELIIRPEPVAGAEFVMTFKVGEWRRAISKELLERWRAEKRAKSA